MIIRSFGLVLAAMLAAAAAEANFGLIAMTPFENARLTAYCDGSVAPNPCAVTLEFHDVAGRTLKEATITLQPGTGGFLDFTPPPSIAGTPIQIDPCFDVLRGAALTSLEVFDSFTHRTRILTNWGDRSMPRRGDIDFSFTGITAFDKLRLGAVCEGDGSVVPSPCDVTVEFHDLQGNTIKQSRLTLQPGTAGFVDLSWAETRIPSRRVELQPCFKVATGTIVGSVSIIDNLLGATVAHAYPSTLVAP